MADNEREEEILRTISLGGDGESVRRENELEQRREAVRQLIIAEIGLALREYNQEGDSFLAEGKTVLTDVVKPWWQDVVQSGLFKKILDLTDTTSRRRARASTNIEFFAPFERVRQLRHAEHYGMRAFASEAKGLVPSVDVEVSPEEIQRFAGRADRWGVHFSIGRIVTLRTETINTGLYAEYTQAGQRQGSGGVALLDFSDTDLLFRERVSPKHIVEFGKQIQQGVVWDCIERSVTGLLDFHRERARWKRDFGG